MPLLDLHHVALRTRDLPASEHFYTEVLGMLKVDRPQFDFPGAWLQMGQTMFHLMAGYAAEGPNGESFEGSAAVDHLALKAQDFDAMRENFDRLNVAYRQNDLQDFAIWQLFVDDPDGVVIELNFHRVNEPPEARGPNQATLSKVSS
jgi:catechol 2,3-dioxygenase-like lactoylglutathione lyase family enzyme